MIGNNLRPSSLVLRPSKNIVTSKSSLIIFTRYPEEGKTKTRLIPAIGAKKAAEFQKQMTEMTIAKASELMNKLAVDVEVYFNGGNTTLMENWLGKEFNYRLQAEGDLGAKMYSAFSDCVDRGSEKIIIIGIDCPSLSVEILCEALSKLDEYPMVLGGADDGGYYLLGLRASKLDQSLFTGIDWGTGKVFEQTMGVANRLEYKLHQLPILQDIDRPEDLEFWYKQQ